jgi:aspartate ammonia-lyase
MSFRTEKDFLGEKQLPDNAYYGVQTQRGKENFHITGIPMSTEPYFVKAFGYVKKAAALANRDLGVLDATVANAIAAACDRLIAGEMADQFVTDFIQGGAGTSTNMNANEVIANLALEQLGHQKGEYQYVNPNDHVNFGQSTNDVYPTAFRLALILRLGSYMDALRGCRRHSSPRPGSSTGCSRWAAPTCRTRCPCRWARSSTAGAPRSARRCSASPRCASSCTRSTWAPRPSAPP